MCAKFALINAWSLRNKAFLILDHTKERSLDVVAIKETWLGVDDTIAVSELCGENFTFVCQPRGGIRRGGGVGIMFRKTLQLISHTTLDTHVCETYCVILRNFRIGYTTRVIVVYRPPAPDFRSFLDDVGKCYSSLLLTRMGRSCAMISTPDTLIQPAPTR